jgi:hypothetical protein
MLAPNRKSTQGQLSTPPGWRALSERRVSAIALLLLVAQPLIFFRKVLFHPTAHIPFDIQQFHLPLTTYIARCVRDGIFPFWDPYPYCGTPIHADLQAQLFYPLTWISILLGNMSNGHKLFLWLEWLVPVHMILAGLFTFFLLRRLDVAAPSALLGGTVYQLGGLFASQTQHLGVICCAAWLPLMLLCVLQLSRGITIRWIAVLGLSVALAILAGFAAAAAVVFGAAALFTVGLSVLRRPNWKLFAALSGGVVLGLGIVAVQIVPTYQLTRLSIAATRSEYHVNGGGLRVQSLMSLVAPNYYHIFTPFDPALYKLPINFTFLYVYCGIITLALILLAPFLRRASQARMLFLLTAISAIWMLGDTTPVYRFVYTHLPRLVRGALYSEYALMAFSMFAALTAAVALQRVARRAPRLLPLGIALCTAVDLTYFGARRPMNSYEGSYAPETSEFDLYRAPGSLAKMQTLLDRTNPPLRVDYLDRTLDTFVVASEMLKLPSANGDNPFALQRVVSIRKLFCAGGWWERLLTVNRPASPLVDMLNIGFLLSSDGLSPDRLQHTRLELAADIAGVRFYRKPDPLPRFFLVPRLHASHGPDETFSYLARPGFAPAEEAVVETQDLRAEAPPGSGAVKPDAPPGSGAAKPDALPGSGAIKPDAPLGGGIVKIERYSPNRVEIGVVASNRAFLASSEALYPGWTVTVNGTPARFYLTNGAFRGVMLNPGVNRIVMTYWPERFLLWAAISVVSVLLAVAGIVCGGSRKIPSAA